MPDRVTELLRELRERWDDPYWWADHQALRITLLSLLSGVLGLLFVYLDAKLKRRLAQ